MVMMALEGIERVLNVGDLRVVRNAIASHMHTEQASVLDEKFLLRTVVCSVRNPHGYKMWFYDGGF